MGIGLQDEGLEPSPRLNHNKVNNHIQSLAHRIRTILPALTNSLKFIWAIFKLFLGIFILTNLFFSQSYSDHLRALRFLSKLHFDPLMVLELFIGLQNFDQVNIDCDNSKSRLSCPELLNFSLQFMYKGDLQDTNQLTQP